jgi:hypothetical protein
VVFYFQLSWKFSSISKDGTIEKGKGPQPRCLERNSRGISTAASGAKRRNDMEPVNKDHVWACRLILSGDALVMFSGVIFGGFIFEYFPKFVPLQIISFFVIPSLTMGVVFLFIGLYRSRDVKIPFAAFYRWRVLTGLSLSKIPVTSQERLAVKESLIQMLRERAHLATIAIDRRESIGEGITRSAGAIEEVIETKDLLAFRIRHRELLRKYDRQKNLQRGSIQNISPSGIFSRKVFRMA